MVYDLRRSRKDEEQLTPEEEDVRRALQRYTDDPDKADPLRDFVPTRELYRTYREYLAGCQRFPDDPDQLTIRQFGAALLRVFPHLAEIDPDTGRPYAKAQRRINGRREWGWTGLRGPGTLQTYAEPGNPQFLDVPDDDR